MSPIYHSVSVDTQQAISPKKGYKAESLTRITLVHIRLTQVNSGDNKSNISMLNLQLLENIY